jgi:hypothetical protein
MTDNIQEKRDVIELQASLLDETTKAALVRMFEKRLVGYLFDVLNPEKSDGEALASRFKAIGIVETLQDLGVSLQHLMDAPVRKAINRDVRRTLHDSQPWS